MNNVLRLALWCGVAVLTLLGVASAVGRAASVASGGLTYEQLSTFAVAELWIRYTRPRRVALGDAA